MCSKGPHGLIKGHVEVIWVEEPKPTEQSEGTGMELNTDPPRDAARQQHRCHRLIEHAKADSQQITANWCANKTKYC